LNERRTPDDESGPSVDAAWRAQSREEPPAAIDEAIRAAACREAEARSARTARSPRPAWMRWMPFAAAAGVAALAFGLLRWLPADQGLRQTTPVPFPASSPRPTPGTARNETVPAERSDTSPLLEQRAPAAAAQTPLSKSSADSRAREAPVTPPPVPQSPGNVTARTEAPSPPAAVESDAASAANESRSAVDNAAPSAAGAPAAENETSISTTSARQSVQQKAADDEESVRRITDLYDAGRFDDAAAALRKFRKADPHADQRLPESLRAWAATVRD
jgi:hypothetical protein